MDIRMSRNIRMNLFSAILDFTNNENNVIRDVNYFDSLYKSFSDNLYSLSMRKVGESYEYDNNLDLDSRKKVVEGMVFANLKLKDSDEDIGELGPNQRLSYVLNELPIKNNIVELDSFKEDYFRYGIMVESLIGSFKDFPKESSRKKIGFIKKRKKNTKKINIMV